jgi:hypothetical protein
LQRQDIISRSHGEIWRPDDDGNLDDAKLRKAAAHDQVKMIEIKPAPRCKAGKGGILPAAKISAEIEIRGIP